MPTQSIRRTWDYAQLAKETVKLRFSREGKAKHAAQCLVAQRLGKLRGLPQKMGQMIAFRSSETDSNAFDSLYESSEPLPWSTMRSVLEAAWEADPESLFQQINPAGKAASLGQVHHATLSTGHEVAIKIQYPGIRQAVLADLHSLGWLAKPFGNLSQGFDFDGYRTTILQRLEEELDYKLEAKAQKAFAVGPGQNPWVIVPRVDEELSCENVLVSQWIDGETWQQVIATWPSDQRRELGRRLLVWFLESVFCFGQLHADLHPGNVRFQRTEDGPKIVLYDFGSVYRMDDSERLALLRLIRATRQQDESPLPLLTMLGFEPDLLQPMSARLPALCRVLLEPFCVDHPYDTRRWSLSERLNDVLGEDRMNFRIAGPPRLIYVLRAFQGIVNYLKGLDAKVLWGQAIERYLQEYQKELNALVLPKIAGEDFATIAQRLKVQVSRNGRLKANVTLAASAIDRLEQFLDEETLSRIQEEKIDLQQITADVRRRGYAPGSVFELSDPRREVKVWLE